MTKNNSYLFIIINLLIQLDAILCVYLLLSSQGNCSILRSGKVADRESSDFALFSCRGARRDHPDDKAANSIAHPIPYCPLQGLSG